VEPLRETRTAWPFNFQKKLKPVLGTWDDHDFGGNNVNGAFIYQRRLARDL